MSMFQSTNPALANDDVFSQYYGRGMFDSRANVATLQGVVNKTAILTAITIAAGVLGYWLVGQWTSILLVSNIAAALICFGIALRVCGKPESAVYLAPVYAVVEGVFLGALTCAAEWLLAQRHIKVPGGVALQAFIVTGSALAAMLTLYKLRILRPTRMVSAFVYTATAAIMFCYLLSWPLALFGLSVPLISWNSALNSTGSAAWLGLGLNLFILIIASMGLINDFGMIEERLSKPQPKHMEWYCGFALLVTLAWIYYESVKLVVRTASMFSKR